MRIESGIIDHHEIPDPALAAREPVTSAAVQATTPVVVKAQAAVEHALAPPIAEMPGIFAGFLGNIARGIASLFESAVDTARGALRSLADAFTGPVHALAATAGMVVLVAGKAASVIQTLLHLESPGRRLNQDELEVLKRVYGNGINLSEVRLKEGKAGVFSLPNERRFTLGNTIYTNSALPLERHTLVHEMVHVWQFQQRGAGYIAESLVSQLRLGVDETYTWSHDAQAGTAFKDWNPERQAQLLEDAFEQHFFDNEATGRVFGKDGTDGSAALREALKEIRGAHADAPR